MLPQSRLLATTLAATKAEVEAGRLSVYGARKISDSLANLAVRVPDTARAIEAQVLTNAADIKLPSLTSKLRRLVLAVRDPEEALEEHLEGARDRRVRVDSELWKPRRPSSPERTRRRQPAARGNDGRRTSAWLMR